MRSKLRATVRRTLYSLRLLSLLTCIKVVQTIVDRKGRNVTKDLLRNFMECRNVTKDLLRKVR